MLISIHIPKTGGVTFRSILQAHFREKILLDYADQPMSHSTLGRNFKTLRSSFYMPRSFCNQYLCIHGHFLPLKYSFLRKKSMIIWLRDPVERIISRYFYMKNYSDFDSHQFKTYIKNKDITLEDFCRIPHYHNMYAKYLWGVNLSDFDFIGITEKYNESLDFFSNKFSIPISLKEKLNENPIIKKNNDLYEVNSSLKNIIYSNNKKDFILYEKALLMSNI